MGQALKLRLEADLEAAAVLLFLRIPLHLPLTAFSIVGLLVHDWVILGRIFAFRWRVAEESVHLADLDRCQKSVSLLLIKLDRLELLNVGGRRDERGLKIV